MNELDNLEKAIVSAIRLQGEVNVLENAIGGLNV